MSLPFCDKPSMCDNFQQFVGNFYLISLNHFYWISSDASINVFPIWQLLSGYKGSSIQKLSLTPTPSPHPAILPAPASNLHISSSRESTQQRSQSYPHNSWKLCFDAESQTFNIRKINLPSTKTICFCAAAASPKCTFIVLRKLIKTIII